MIKQYAIILVLALPAFGQTLNNATVDFTLFGITKPVTMGSNPPSSCQDGQLYFDTSKPAGANLSTCYLGVWTTVGAGVPISMLPQASTIAPGIAMYGTVANTAAQGNDPRIVGALQLGNNLSDLGSLSAARANLGLSAVAQSGSWSDLVGVPATYALPIASTATLGGVIDGTGVNVSSTGVLTVNYGITSTTAAAGNDGRITGAAQKALNLSDLANVTTALLNLKLTGTAPTTIASNTTGNAATATQFAATPLPCASGRYATSVAANGNAACGQVQYSQVASTPAAYALPIATTSRLGGVIDGTGIGVSSTGVISVNYGSTSGTAAQGNDGRITGAAQKALNLSDLASVTTALTNLKLTGTTPATIASSTTGNAATATALRGTGALRLKGLCGTAPTLATGQVGLWLDTADCNMHLQDLSGNQSVMVRTSIAGVDQGCTPGFAMTDISPAGVPVCTALPVPPPPPPSLAGQLCPSGNAVAGVDATSRLVCTPLPIVPPPPTGVTVSGSSCTITAISNGVITAATCTP